MRIVLDTNVLARAATGPAGPAGEVLRLVVPPNALVVSPFLIAELSRILRYERMRRLHRFDDDAIDDFVQQIESSADVVDLPDDATGSVVPGDPDDDPVIATAAAGGAEIICTRDRHFQHPTVQAYCSGRGIRVMSDVELLGLLRQAETDETA